MQPESLTQIIQSQRAQEELLRELEKFRRAITVMFTDIKGSTAYFEKYGDVAGLLLVHQCNDMLRQIVERHGGRVIKEIGDAIMASFEDPAESIQAAIEMQKGLIGFNAPRPQQDHVFIRIGLNYGSGIVKSNDVFGDVVNVASRVESVAQPQQIVISDTMEQQVSASGTFRIAHLGRFALKGKEGDRDLYEVLWDEDQTAKAAAAHTMVMAGAKFAKISAGFKLQHIRKDGTVGQEHPLKDGKLTVGQSSGDLQFAADATLGGLHARFYVEGGQVWVEDLSGSRGVYVRLVGTYPLREDDVVMIGRQQFEFHSKANALAVAAAVGQTITAVSSALNENIAELVRVGAGFSPADRANRFPLHDNEVSFGRSKAKFTFPEDGFMSGLHARVYQRGEDFFIEDAGSRNGTFLKVRGKSPVPIGATVLLGNQLLKLAEA